MTCWPTCSSIARTVLWTRHKNGCFWTVVLEKTLESPLDCKEIQPVHPKGNQSWISLEGLMLKLKLQYFGHLMQRADSFEKPWCWERLKAEGEGDGRGWDGWMASLTWWTWVWVGSGSWQWTGKPGELQSMGSQGGGHNWATELTDWTVNTHTHTHLHPPHNDEIKFIFYGRTRINTHKIFSPCLFQPSPSLHYKLTGGPQGWECLPSHEDHPLAPCLFSDASNVTP